MGGTTAEAQVAKKCYKNQTAGWLGVVKLNHLGGQEGHSIPPHGTIWLTDDEAILTARAPADPKDNPFEEQNFLFEDAQGTRVEEGMRPLILVEDARYSPSDDRFVPHSSETLGESPIDKEAITAARRDTRAVLRRDDSRPVPSAPQEETPIPSSPAVPAEHATAGQPESWVDNPDRTDEPQPGNLRGSDEPAGDGSGDEARTGSPTAPPPQQPAPSSVASSVESAPTKTVEEEHAGVTKTGEETGAADIPNGEAPEGEFAKNEEVGTPDAPTQGASS